MSLPIFPVLPGLTFTVVKTPEFNTLDMKSPNGYEVRIAQTINPLWNYTLIYDFLHDFPWGSFTTVSELRTMMGFYLQVSGKNASFLFDDPDDDYVGPAIVSASPNTPLAELSIVTDGTYFYSPIQRTLDGVFYEDITDLNGAITVYDNGVLQTIASDYTVNGPGLALPTASYMGLYLKWVSEPTGPVTVQFHFYFRVRFQSDSQDFEKFCNVGSAAVNYAGQGGGIWTIGGSEAVNGTGTLKLTTARPTPLANGSGGGGGGGGGGELIYPGQGTATSGGSYDTITLGSTPIGSSVSVFINGFLLAPTGYSIAVNVITLGTGVLSGAVVVVEWLTANSSPGGITLS